MNKTQRDKYIKNLLDKWTKVMHLTNWEFAIEHHKKNHDNGDIFLTIRPCEIYCNARLHVYPTFWKQPKDVREQAIVHELLHCKLEPLAVVAYDLLAGKLYTRDRIISVVENIVQNLATVIRPLDNKFYVDGK